MPGPRARTTAGSPPARASAPRFSRNSIAPSAVQKRMPRARVDDRRAAGRSPRGRRATRAARRRRARAGSRRRSSLASIASTSRDSIERRRRRPRAAAGPAWTSSRSPSTTTSGRRAASRAVRRGRARRGSARACRRLCGRAWPAATVSRWKSWLPSTRDRGVAQRLHLAQHRERVRAAIDEVADEPQPVAARREADQLEKLAELGVTALDVADRVESSSMTFRRSLHGAMMRRPRSRVDLADLAASALPLHPAPSRCRFP